MKNKNLFLCLVLMVSTLCFVSCKQREDITPTTKAMAEASMLGTDSVFTTVLNDSAAMSITVVEYHFLPNHGATQTTVAVGNGLYQDFGTTEMTYAVGEFQSNGFGLKLKFTPLNANMMPYDALFANGTLIIADTLVLDEQMAKVESLNKVVATLPDTKWTYHEETLWIDTTYRDSTTIYKHAELDSTGQRIIVYDTVTIVIMECDTVGIRSTLDCIYEFDRNATTLAQTGTYSLTKQSFTHELEPETPETETMDYHWYISNITSNLKFSVSLRNSEQEEEDVVLKFMKFKPADGSCTIDGQKFTTDVPN